MKAKILILDLETAAAQVHVFGLRDQNIGLEQVVHDSYCLMWAARWLGSKETIHDSLIDHPTTFRDDKRNDKQIAKSLRKLLDEAQIVVTQNGNNFDLKWANTLFLKWDIPKPSKYYSVDLLKESRSNYFSISHKLDFRGRQLAIGSKITHEGFKLWKACMDGNRAAWGRMIEYCKRDVELTERYYLKLRPRMKNHPNVNMFVPPEKQSLYGRLKCVTCGSSSIHKTGYNYCVGGRRQRFECNACHHRMTLTGPMDRSTKVAFRSEA